VVPGITAGLLAQSSATQDLSDVVEKRLLDIALIGRFDLNNCATSDAYERTASMQIIPPADGERRLWLWVMQAAPASLAV